MTTPSRWVIKFMHEPGLWIKAGGKPSWTPERVYLEALRAYGPHLTGRFLPPHLKSKPRLMRVHGVKGFARLDRMGDVVIHRLSV